MATEGLQSRSISKGSSYLKVIYSRRSRLRWRWRCLFHDQFQTEGFAPSRKAAEDAYRDTLPAIVKKLGLEYRTQKI